MKILIYMKSRFAYDRLKNELDDHDVYQYVESFEEIQEALTYWNPEVSVLDQQCPYYNETKELLYRFSVDVIDFQSDFESVLDDIKTFSLFHEEKDTGENEKYIPDQSDYKAQVNQEVNKKKEQQVKIEIRKEIIEKEVERLKYATIPSKLIVVGSMWNGAGSTTFSMNLARAIAKRSVYVSYVEYPTIKPYVFDYLNVNEKEQEQDFPFPDLAREMNDKGFIPPGRGWNYEGIQWVINDTRYPTIEGWNYEKMIKLIYSIRNTPITIVDISNNWLDPDIKDFLHHADAIYVCVEPDPIKIDWLSTIYGVDKKTEHQREEHKILVHLKNIQKSENIHYHYVTLRMNEKVDRDTWEACLEKKPISYLPNIPYEDAIQKAWESRFLYDDDRFQPLFEKAFRPIIEDTLPISFKFLEGHKEAGKLDKLMRPIQSLLKRRNEDS